MPEWERVRLGEVLTRSRSAVMLEPTELYKQVTVRMRHKGVTLREQKRGADIGSPRQYVARPGQFIISSIDARNGAMGLVPDELDGAIVTNDFWLFDVDERRLNREWLRLYASTPDFVDACTGASEGSTNRVRLQPDRFLALEIPLPPLPEQRRIVARVKGLLDKVGEVSNLREELRKEKSFLLKAAVKAEFDGLNDCPVVPLESVCSAIIDNLHSNPEYAETGVPCVRSSDVSWFELNLDSAKRTSEDEYIRRTVRGEPQEDDIVLVREGGGTGKAAIVRAEQRFSLGQRVMMIRVNTDVVMPEFFLHQLLSPQIQESQIASSFKGSAAPHLNIGSLRKFDFILPPLHRQKELLYSLNRLYENQNGLMVLSEASSIELDALPASILARAFAGAL